MKIEGVEHRTIKNCTALIGWMDTYIGLFTKRNSQNLNVLGIVRNWRNTPARVGKVGKVARKVLWLVLPSKIWSPLLTNLKALASKLLSIGVLRDLCERWWRPISAFKGVWVQSSLTDRYLQVLPPGTQCDSIGFGTLRSLSTPTVPLVNGFKPMF